MSSFGHHAKSCAGMNSTPLPSFLMPCSRSRASSASEELDRYRNLRTASTAGFIGFGVGAAVGTTLLFAKLDEAQVVAEELARMQAATA